MDSTFNFYFAETAKNDLDQIFTYVQNNLENPQAADNLLDEITATINNLCLFPQSAAVFKSMNLSIEIRFTKIKKYLLFYTIDYETNYLIILYIKHSLQSLKSIDMKY